MDILEIQRLDHLGIVAGTIKKLGLIEFIDSRIPPSDMEHITVGEAVAGMILNGLGFSNRPISLTPQFFENKPLDLLFRSGVQSEHFNRFKLGRSLDDLHDYGCDLLFAEIANHVCKAEGIETQFQSIDTTTFSVTGENYPDSDEHEIKVTYGYSKDHRPDLRQMALELIVSHDGGVPLMAQSHNGNASDNQVFKDRLEAMIKSLKESESLGYLVADSKLYVEGNAENLKELPFITRIPGTIHDESKIIKKAFEKGVWEKIDNENAYQSFIKTHYGMNQRWIVVHSKAATTRATKAVNKIKEKEEERLKKSIKKLERKEFCCERDARRELEKLKKSLKLHKIVSEKYLQVMGYNKRGRPDKESDEKVKGWKIEIDFEFDKIAFDKNLNLKSCYVLGTNVPCEKLTDEAVISGYKSQNKVEMGFRFLKDPEFFTSSLFLKKPARLSGLLMVMTLSLLVYSIAQRELRKSLQLRKETLPNQIKQKSEKPTLKWIFQLLEGINRVKIRYQERSEIIIQGITDLRKTILSHFGSDIQALYGLIQ